MNKDWREQGQENYLNGLKFKKQKYVKYRDDWDHDHCEFCSKKICENTECLNEGYATSDKYRWICLDCFQTFKEKYNLLEAE
jgi:hypothetical protein